MYIFKNQIGMSECFKIPDVILSLVSSQNLNWTHTFDTHCIVEKHPGLCLLRFSMILGIFV